MATDDIADRAAGFGMPGVIVDGFDFFAVYEAAGEAIERARDGDGPTLIEVKFTRYYGHFEGDQQLYRADEVANAAGEPRLPQALPGPGHRGGPAHRRPARRGRRRGRRAHRRGRRRGQGRADAGRGRPAHRRLRLVLRRRTMARSITYREAINEALAQEMERDPSVIVMGEDIAGGAGLAGRGGRLGRRPRRHQGPLPQVRRGRVLDTPITESAFIGAAVGAATGGLRPVAELMFVDFMGVCFDQIFNQAAKFRYMFGGKAVTPVVIRTMCGAGLRRRRPAQPVAALDLHPHPRPQGGRAVQRLRRQGPAHPVHPRRRPGDLLRAQDALRRGRRRAGGELRDPVRRGQRRARG